MMVNKWHLPPWQQSSPTAFADLSEEVEEVLDGWVEDGYRDLIDNTEFLDSSRVKRID